MNDSSKLSHLVSLMRRIWLSHYRVSGEKCPKCCAMNTCPGEHCPVAFLVAQSGGEGSSASPISISNDDARELTPGRDLSFSFLFFFFLLGMDLALGCFPEPSLLPNYPVILKVSKNVVICVRRGGKTERRRKKERKKVLLKLAELQGG